MRVRARDLVGKRIVAVKFNRFSDGSGGWATDPVIELDDGSMMSFLTQETGVGRNGTVLRLRKRGAQEE